VFIILINQDVVIGNFNWDHDIFAAVFDELVEF